MYENYTTQSLPEADYRELLGSTLYVFCSNNAFIIGNIINTDDLLSWYELIDKESGNLKNAIGDTISAKTGNTKTDDLFIDIVNMRNRIVHGFGITSSNGEQILATKMRKNNGNEQFVITQDYLMDFIKKNKEFSDLLYEYRGY